MPSPATIRVQSQDQSWQTLGADRYRGILPEGIKPTANGWGPDLLNFTLKRRPGTIFPDLASWTPCEVEIGGIVVWDGTIKEAPEQDGESFQIGVVGQGWQYHLDDDTNEKLWVHTRLPDWADRRSHNATNLNTATGGSYPAACTVASDRGGITLGHPRGSVFPNSARVGVFLDAGPGQTIKRVVVTYKGNPDAGAFQFVLYSTDTPFTAEVATLVASDPIPNATTTTGVTLATARRYVSLVVEDTVGADQTPGQDMAVNISAIQVFSSTAYESGNASILKSSDLVKDVLPWAPLLSQDKSLISSTIFNWPEFAPFDEKTAREIIEAANAAERMQARLRIGKQLEYRAFPTRPLFEIGEWSGAEFKDTSAGSGQEVYNKAKIKGTGPDGVRLTITRTQAGTLLDRFGRTRTKVLVGSFGLNTALGNQLGDKFLSVHKTMPLKGDVQVIGRGGVRRIEGGAVDPAHLLIHSGELMRLAHRINPDDGSWGRDGQIAQVGYDHDTETAVVTLDNQRDNFEALLERMGAVLGSG
jgi:hypothetical protein